jgi:hypothetical protein
MTIVRFDENKTLTLGTLKKRAKDVLEYTFILEKLGLANSGKALGKFTTYGVVKAHARIGEWDVWCNEDDQTIHFLRAGTDTSQDLKYYLVRTSEGFDLIPDPKIAPREQAHLMEAKLPHIAAGSLEDDVLKEYAIQEQDAREALDDEDAQYHHDAMLEDREQQIQATVVEHAEPSRVETEQRVQRIREDAESKANFEARIEKAVTRTTPGPKRSVDGRIQQMLGVRSQMVGKKKLVVTNGGDPNCKRCAAEPVPCKAHGGARKRKAARELQAIFC